MLTITGLAKEKNLFKVTFSNHETLLVSEDQLVRHRLLKGQEISEAELQELKDSSRFDLGLQESYRYISYQLRSEKEVDQFLKEHELPLKDRKKVIERLKELNLVNDKIYAESYVRTQMRLSGKGPGAIRQQLLKKGIKGGTAEDALALYEEKEQLAVALHTGEKALRRIHGKSFKETGQKLRQSLMQKGFGPEEINQVLAELLVEKDQEAENAALEKEADKLWRRHQSKPREKRNQKIKQSLYQKGFDLMAIQQYLDSKEEMDD